MQAHWPACKLMDLYVSSWTCSQAHGFAIYMHASSWIYIHSETFWIILEHSGSFWIILDHSGSFLNILEHSGTFWNILDVVEGCSKVDFHVDQTQTHRQTDLHSGAFWSILEHPGCCRECSKVDFQVDQTQTHGQTDIN